MGEENAAVLLSLIDGIVMTVIGPDAVMNEFERMLIEEPLARILGRIEWETGERINQWADPIMLLFGLIGWGSRIYDLAKEKRAQAQPVHYTEAPQYQTGEPDVRKVEKEPESPEPIGSNIDLGELSTPPIEINMRNSDRVKVREDLIS